MDYLTGKDYPWLCGTCQSTVDRCAEIVAEGPDTDDEEAPCDMAYDHRLFCGGHRCENRQEVTR